MRMMSLLVLAAMVLAGCAAERAPNDAETASAQVPQAVRQERTSPTETPTDAGSDTSTTGVPASTPPSVPNGDRPTPIPDGDLNLARFSGYGDIPFGTPVADMTRLWGGELKVIGKDLNDQCYFMIPAGSKRPADFSFMISEGRFARLSVESANFVAPGGARVGMTKAEVIRRYPGHIDVQPHKYSDGQYLRVKDPASGKAVLLMETDGKGDDARVTEWRVGVPPEVDYVAGCS